MNNINYLEWVDSEAPENEKWIEIDSISDHETTHLCISVGFVVKEDQNNVWISHSIDPANNCCHSWFKIPKVAITKRKILENG